MKPQILPLAIILFMSSVQGVLAGNAPAKQGPACLNEIHSKSDFDTLAGPGFLYLGDALQVLFLIDLEEPGKTYFIDTKRYRWHYDFMEDVYLSTFRGRSFNENVLYSLCPRFVVGSIEPLADETGFAYRIWNNKNFRNDSVTFESVLGILKNSFFLSLEGPLSYEPFSLSKDGYTPINPGTTVGRLRLVAASDAEFGLQDIVVLPKMPQSLPMVSGIILLKPLSPASHLIVLANSLGIPVFYVPEGPEYFQKWSKKWICLIVGLEKFEIRRATRKERKQAELQGPRRQPIRLPSDIETRELTDLKDQRGVDYIRFGSKSSNLGELMHSGIPGFTVPRGFTIPFYYYVLFIRSNNLGPLMQKIIHDPRIREDRAYRSKKLAQLRKRFRAGAMPPDLKRMVIEKQRVEYPNAGLFVRSSSNAEDLPGFTGAGLYETVPNVRSPGQLIPAIKEVWASLWNERAFAARERIGIRHQTAQMAVLLQEGIAADNAGVVFTKNPFNPEQTAEAVIYIAAKQGLGIRVVQGEKVPEQILYTPRSDTMTLISQSEDDVKLVLARRGGVISRKVKQGKPVLHNEFVRRLGSISLKIEKYFGGIPQDIEWLTKGKSLYIVQTRPFIGSFQEQQSTP